ncbi:MAG: hypothetical protein D6767_10470 [Candidatus Hydrogenedentota bacterium]|nr:MAG: hypothetical protein D6767_10470 [Candidatus Hydrogenedentota bacterium]
MNQQKEKTPLFSKSHQPGESFNKHRKIYHLFGLLIPLIFYFNTFDYLFTTSFKETTRSISFYILLGLNIFLWIVEILRFNFEWWQDLFIKTAGKLLKEKEYTKIHSSVPFLLSNMLVVGFMPKELAVLSIAFLLIGDPVAAYVGEHYGSIRFKNGKSIQGMLGGMTSAFLAGLFFLLLVTLWLDPKSPFVLWNENGLNGIAWMVLVAGSISAFLFELISGHGLLDDNMTIPLGSSFVMVWTYSVLTGLSFSEILYSWRDLLFPH